MRYFRQEFDREREFVCARSFVFNARAYVPGQPIDKSRFTVRRLRQLFDNRYLAFAPERSEEPAPPPVPPEQLVERPRTRRRLSTTTRRRLELDVSS